MPSVPTMLTFESLQNAWDQNRIVRMQVSKEYPELHAEASWAVHAPTENDPGISSYCADVEKAVTDLYIDPPNANEHTITLQNSIIEGITSIQIQLEDQEQTMIMVRHLLQDMRRAIYETFHPEINAERQRWMAGDTVEITTSSSQP